MVKNKYFASLTKATLVTLFFILAQLFYDIEVVRSNIEDIGFDITNKIVLEKRTENLAAPKLMLFGFDDAYMQSEGLFDENNKTNYGYLFPRDRIGRFIADLDDFCLEVSPKNHPKALFIDYDFSYSSMPYGKNLAKEDNELLEILKKDRPYIILLPKTDQANLIEQSNDPILQQHLKEGKIVLVSVALLSSSDGATRRYLAYKQFREKTYLNADVALWQLANNNEINTTLATQSLKARDIISNRIVLKGYVNQSIEDGCQTSQSYWKNYRMYSANCSLFDIIEEDFAGSLVMLGGTYSDNTDQFDVLNIGGSESLKGIELHANTLMSLFYFDGQLEPLSFWKSVGLVFTIFLVVDLIVGMLFTSRLLRNVKLHFMIVMIVMSASMFGISLYLLLYHSLWFNWFVPVVLFEMVDLFFFVKMKFNKFRKKG